MSAFRVKLGANDLNSVDVPLNPTRSLTSLILCSLSHLALYCFAASGSIQSMLQPVHVVSCEFFAETFSVAGFFKELHNSPSLPPLPSLPSPSLPSPFSLSPSPPLLAGVRGITPGKFFGIRDAHR